MNKLIQKRKDEYQQSVLEQQHGQANPYHQPGEPISNHHSPSSQSNPHQVNPNIDDEFDLLEEQAVVESRAEFASNPHKGAMFNKTRELCTPPTIGTPIDADLSELADDDSLDFDGELDRIANEFSHQQSPQQQFQQQQQFQPPHHQSPQQSQPQYQPTPMQYQHSPLQHYTQQNHQPPQHFQQPQAAQSRKPTPAQSAETNLLNQLPAPPGTSSTQPKHPQSQPPPSNSTNYPPRQVPQPRLLSGQEFIHHQGKLDQADKRTSAIIHRMNDRLEQRDRERELRKAAREKQTKEREK